MSHQQLSNWREMNPVNCPWLLRAWSLEESLLLPFPLHCKHPHSHSEASLTNKASLCSRRRPQKSTNSQHPRTGYGVPNSRDASVNQLLPPRLREHHGRRGESLRAGGPWCLLWVCLLTMYPGNFNSMVTQTRPAQWDQLTCPCREMLSSVSVWLSRWLDTFISTWAVII